MWFTLRAPIILKVVGKDSQRYLNARLSNDSRSISVGGSYEATALTAQGRIEGHFRVTCTAENEYLLFCEGGDREGVKAAFGRYIVADRVTVTDLSETWKAYVVAPQSGELHECATAVHAIGGVLISAPILADGSAVVLTPIESSAEVIAVLMRMSSEELSEESFNFIRAERGVPFYPYELNDSIMFNESGLTNAVSFTKGCYVGQEVVERSDAIGRVPRLLQRVTYHSEVMIEAGTPVKLDDGSDIGKVISSYKAPTTNRQIAFCLLRNGRFNRGDSVVLDDVSAHVM